MKIYFYSGTHWDREWYQSFQGFRYRLVEMTSFMVENLKAAKDYGVFHFDGQTIVLEDVLAICPQLRGELTSLIQQGRIIIGPWYCMPDEFLVSGESLIKNLKKGHKLAESFGVKSSKNGYICDIFGHIAQMPQIFAGMDIHHAVLGRGTNEATTDMHFKWVSPDGTEIFAFKIPDNDGYCDFSAQVIVDTAPVIDIDYDAVEKRTLDYVEKQMKRANIPVMMLMDACDHNNFHPQTHVYIDMVKKLFPNAEVYHTNIADMNAEVEKYADSLSSKHGELIETAINPDVGFLQLLTHILSSYYPLKRYNDILQTRLEKWVAPLYALKLIDEPRGFMDLADEYLMKNQPHDSICGCSIDQVHVDMRYRYNQADLITKEIIARFRKRLKDGVGLNAVQTKSFDESKRILRIFTPLPYSTNRVIEVDIGFEPEWPKYVEPGGYYQKLCGFKLFNFNGEEIPYGIIDMIPYPKVTKDIYTTRYKIAFTASVPAGGTAEYEIRPFAAPCRYLSLMAQTAKSVDNGIIRLEINNDGTMNLTDLKSGIVYPNLLTMLDNGEIGDGWNHLAPLADCVVTNSMARIEKIENTVNRVGFKITVCMMLPKELEASHIKYGYRRGSDYTPFEIVHKVYVARGEKEVKIKTEINNNVKDHRLKVRFPTQIQGSSYSANQAFCFVERKAGVNENTACWKECEALEKQTDGIVIKKNGDNGFAFVSLYGLHECGVSESGDIDITLLRSFYHTVETTGETQCQIQEKLEYEYAILPVGKDDTMADIQRLQTALQTGVETVTLQSNSINEYTSSFEIVNGGKSFVYSTANALDNGAEIRIYNASNNQETGTIKLPGSITSAMLTHIDGRQIKELCVTDGCVTITLGKWQIATINFS